MQCYQLNNFPTLCSLHPLLQSRLPRRRGVHSLDRGFRYHSRYRGVCQRGKDDGNSRSHCWLRRLPRSHGSRRIAFIGWLLADLVSRHRDDCPRPDIAPGNDRETERSRVRGDERRREDEMS